MLTRRHVRIKVMQTLYAHNFNGADDPKTLKAFLKSSIQKTFELH
jgi:transcription termination factor NusB